MVKYSLNKNILNRMKEKCEQRNTSKYCETTKFLSTIVSCLQPGRNFPKITYSQKKKFDHANS